ncbi:hypothetical protein L596_011741 [Steinernema carpocapsae]|uniref:Uncharacterized protein n=1 Tax=Steinernema carpocapsae TaxID=34508 RepID=A0A4U5NUZ6_STECR|nr:hypothetical protein L596_011741 [Steinernema carpocapsae]
MWTHLFRRAAPYGDTKTATSEEACLNIVSRYWESPGLEFSPLKVKPKRSGISESDSITAKRVACARLKARLVASTLPTAACLILSLISSPSPLCFSTTRAFILTKAAPVLPPLSFNSAKASLLISSPLTLLTSCGWQT